MNIYFNEKGKQYTSRHSVTYYPYFSVFDNQTKVNTLFDALTSEINASQLQNKDVFFEKIASMVKYCHNINSKLLETVGASTPNNITTDNEGNQLHVYYLPPVDYDYNSFIYHAKSALDSFFYFIYKNFGSENVAKNKAKKIQKTDSTFNNSYLNIFKLYCSLSTDPVIKNIEKELLVLESSLFNITEKGNKNSLRNILTHESTIYQNTKANFSLFLDTSSNILFIDADVYGHPLVGTTCNITASMTYFLLKSIALILNSRLLNTFNRSDFTVWKKCPFVNFRDYVDPQSEDEIQLLIFTNKGFTLYQEKVNKEELLKNCISSL